MIEIYDGNVSVEGIRVKVEIGDVVRGTDLDGNIIEGRVVDILRKINIVQVRVNEKASTPVSCKAEEIQKI